MTQSKLQLIEEVLTHRKPIRISIFIGTTRHIIWLDTAKANKLLMTFQHAPIESQSKLINLPWHRLLNLTKE